MIHQVIYQVVLFKRQRKTVLIHSLVVSLSCRLYCCHCVFFINHIKASATICGQSTYGVKRPCLRCLTKKDATTVPPWLSRYGFDINKCHEVEMRVGENSREKCWERFITLAGKNRQRIRRNKKMRK